MSETLDEWVAYDARANQLCKDISVHVLELGGLDNSFEEAALLRCIMISIRQWSERLSAQIRDYETALEKIANTISTKGGSYPLIQLLHETARETLAKWKKP